MMQRRLASRVARIVLGAFAGLLALTALVGFAHTRAGRPLLGWMARAMGRHASVCPLGYDRAATPEQKEAARAAFAGSHRGPTPAAGRPALGFVLDRTTRADVLSWAASHAVSCDAGRGMADLTCEHVADDLLPEPFRVGGNQAVWFAFGAGDRLISVTTVASAARPEIVGAAFASVVGDLDTQAGPPSRQQGEASPEQLASGSLYQASAEWRFEDYYAVARATNVGPGGYALTAEYRSLPPAAAGLRP